ncbi:hypothetical protein NUW58_g2238 [Xylaria curta]|uniref:Uncharacterized protein n=1 Tax=Xylaria curta TaxID=42375 RepID=A0ACC1PJC8_9PEZI|nr:hypothetical protein NUW58_g2238 [Xylaria curta]
MYRVNKNGFLNSIARGEREGMLRCLKILHEGPKLLFEVACSVVFFMFITYVWSSLRAPGLASDIGHVTAPDSTADRNLTEGSVSDGLRMVVFGGGDVATPSLSGSQWSDQKYAWTQVMCQEVLGCDTYISFVPKTGSMSMGGAVVSNSLLDAAYTRVSAPTAGSNKSDDAIELDYSWVAKQYLKPRQHDLAAQVDYFLSTSRTQPAANETLWVFNVGYWDIWYLAALPRRLATEVIDASIQDLVFQIERLYQTIRDRGSSAFSNSYSNPGVSSFIKSQNRTGETTRTTFRIFLSRVFDISLTPGFANTRPAPPSPHLSSSQLRNAVFLTKYWDAVLEAEVDDWLATPDPEYWSNTDRIDLSVVKALARKQPLKAGKGEKIGRQEKYGHSWKYKYHGNSNSFPRRRVASYGMSKYLRELMVDRQMRNADLFDHNGLGARPSEDGFLDISMPCSFKVTANGNVELGIATGAGSKTVVCQEPDNYLFYTPFTVSQRAIREVGVRAARRLLEQVEDSSGWAQKARIRKDSGGEREGNQTAEITK